MSFISPQPCTTQVDEDGQCCPNTFIGFCLEDGTPISITMQAGAQLGWTNLLSGVFTVGPPPVGTAVCAVDQVAVALSCETHSITVCQNETAWVTDYSHLEDSPHASGDVGAFVLAVRNDMGNPLAADGDYIPFTTDATGALRVTTSGGAALNCATDSVTICPGDDPIDVVGTVTVTQGTSPWTIGDGGGSITVDAVDLDIRNLVFATDKVDVSGSTIALDAGTLAALETITVLQGTSPWDVSGTVTADTNFDYPEDSIHVSGNPGAFVLAVRNDAGTPLAADGDYIPFTTDNTGALRVNATFSGTISVALDCATDSVTICPGVDPIVVTGTVELGATTLAALETITVNQGTSPWVVSGTVTSNQGTSPWVIGDGGGSITIDGTITADTNFDYPEDSPHVSADIGAFVLAVRNDAGTPLAANGDYIPFTTDATGALRVNAGTTVTQTGRDDTDNQSSVSTGLLTSVDRNYIWDSVGGNWDRWTGAVTQGTSPWVVSGTVTVNQGTSPWITSLDAATLAALESITVQNGAGAAAVNIQDGGNSITIDGSVSISGTVTTADNKIEDAVHVTGDTGSFILGVRNDAAAALTNANGDYSPISTDSAGRVGISDLGGSISIDDNAGSITVDGTVTVTQGTSPWVTSLDAASLAALESITVQNGAGAGAVNIQDGGNSITIDGTVSITGTVTTADNKVEDAVHTTGDTGSFILAVRNDANTAFTNTNGDYSPIAVNANGAIAISDGGNSITVDGTVAVTQSTSPWVVSGTVTANQGTSPWVTSLDAASLAALESITVQNPGGASAVNIQDGGNSITVDGAVTVSGTVATNSERAEDSGHTTGQTGNFVLGVRNDAAATLTSNDLDYTPFATDAAGRIGISDLGGSISIDDNGGSITVDGTVAATQSGAWSVAVNNAAGAAAVNIQDGGNSITVDGTVTITQPTGTITNGAETAVAAVAVQILAANANRKKYFIQNTGTANIRVGTTGVTATTGIRLVPSGTILMEMPNCPTQAVFAIREGATSSIAFAQEIT